MAEGTKYKGDYYAIPYRTNPIMMLYNTAMFEEAGVKPPLRTYDEFYKAADAITKDTDNDGQLDQWMGFAQQKPVWWYRLMDFYCFYIAASEGQRLMENGEIIFNNKTAVEVMEFYQTIFENNYYPKTFFQVEPFTAGKIATVPTGPWHLRYLEKHAPDNLSYDVMSLPVPNEPNGPVHTYTSTHCLGIFSNTEHPRAVWKFVKFITSVQSELTMLKSSRQLPARKNLLEIPTFKDFFNSHPLMVKFAKQLPYCPRMDTNENFKEILDEISQQFEACAIYGRKSPEQAIDDAAERAKVIIEWNKSR
jgi:multiple sugar transport system substrate-binding protein